MAKNLDVKAIGREVHLIVSCETEDEADTFLIALCDQIESGAVHIATTPVAES